MENKVFIVMRTTDCHDQFCGAYAAECHANNLARHCTKTATDIGYGVEHKVFRQTGNEFKPVLRLMWTTILASDGEVWLRRPNS